MFGDRSDPDPASSGSLSDLRLDLFQGVDPAPAKAVLPAEFVRIWDATGKHGTREKALKAWKKRGKPTWDAIGSTWLAYLASERPVAGFIQDLSTWLNGGGHTQEWAPAAKAKGAPDDRCIWHRNAQNDSRPSAYPRAGCPRCKHFGAAKAGRESEPTPIAALMRPEDFERRAADVERLRAERQQAKGSP